MRSDIAFPAKSLTPRPFESITGKSLRPATTGLCTCPFSQNQYQFQSRPLSQTPMMISTSQSAMPKEYSIDSNKLSLYSDNEALMGHIMNFAKKNSKEIVKLGIKKPDLNEIFEKLTGERS